MNRESLENAAIKEAIDVYQIEFHLYQNDFANEVPLTSVRCSSIVQSTPIYPYREMKVLITENRDKTSRIVNGQEATAVSCHRNTLLIQFTDQQRPFVYPVTHHGRTRRSNDISINSGLRKPNVFVGKQPADP